MRLTVDTAGTTGTTQARRLPRLLSRALVVLGGTAVATVAGWLISTATASADTIPTIPFGPPASTAPISLADLVPITVTPAGIIITAPALPAEPIRPAAGVAAVAMRLRGAVRGLGNPAGRDASLPPLTAWPSTTPVASTPSGQSSPASGPALARHQLPAPTTVAGSAALSGPATVVHPAARRASAAAPVTPAGPVNPGAPAGRDPGFPVTLPATQGTGGGGAPDGGAVDFADISAVPAAPVPDPVRVRPARAPRRPAGTDRQPGITPD